MIKLEKHKDAKAKEKQDVARSAQNLAYMLEGHQQHNQFNQFLLEAEIDKIESIYDSEIDSEEGLPFLKTCHNMCRDKSGVVSYRSPYSNKYYPPIQDGVFPSPLVRAIEQKGRLLFDEYCKLYYGEGCIGNFFVEEGEEELCFAFYAQKKSKDANGEGIWNSTNIANISGDHTKSITYKVTSSVIYQINSLETESEPYTISGNLRRSKNENKKLMQGEELDQVHLSMIGKLIEENETFLRQQIDSIFVRKSKEIVDTTRIAETREGLEERKGNMRRILEGRAKQGSA